MQLFLATTLFPERERSTMEGESPASQFMLAVVTCDGNPTKIMNSGTLSPLAKELEFLGVTMSQAAGPEKAEGKGEEGETPAEGNPDACAEGTGNTSEGRGKTGATETFAESNFFSLKQPDNATTENKTKKTKTFFTALHPRPRKRNSISLPAY